MTTVTKMGLILSLLAMAAVAAIATTHGDVKAQMNFTQLINEDPEFKIYPYNYSIYEV